MASLWAGKLKLEQQQQQPKNTMESETHIMNYEGG